MGRNSSQSAHSMRNALIMVGIGAVVLLGGIYLLSQRSLETAALPQTDGRPEVGRAADGTGSYDVLVTFDGETFSPSELEVEKGTRVRFLNESDIEVWPASAVHPTHSIYPEKDDSNCLGSSFDSCKRMVRGEYFDFTFAYAGEWRYHDHIIAYKTGVVLVTE